LVLVTRRLGDMIATRYLDETDYDGTTFDETEKNRQRKGNGQKNETRPLMMADKNLRKYTCVEPQVKGLHVRVEPK
jgi:hypothetical protein